MSYDNNGGRMARPQRPKRVCKEPEYNVFTPKNGNGQYIVLSVDEYETIRLIDLEGKSREECADQMDIARTTAQAIYNSARSKLAQCLVDGYELRIEGGSFSLCDGAVRCSHCSKWQNGKFKIDIDEKTEGIMRIAVTFEDGNVFQHFGRTQCFKIFEVEGKEIVKATLYGSNGAGHGALAGLLKDAQVDVLICGGLGQGALNALNQAGIEVIAGASGNVDDNVQAYLDGNLVSTGSNCNHHDHGEGHVCGDHGCH